MSHEKTPGDRYGVAPGRWITIDGKPRFALMLSQDRAGWNEFGPAEADRMAHTVARALNALHLVECLLTDSQLDHVHVDGTTIRQRLAGVKA